MYDLSNNILIGDFHGQASKLLQLLDKVGWQRWDGPLRSPSDASLVFVGDLIEGGDESLRSVEIVVEQGDALCLMGNHEYNAIQVHTEDPDKSGQYLRKHSGKEVDQYDEVLKELEERPTDLGDIVAWFMTLPLAIEGENGRFAHGCWHPGSLDALEQRQPVVDPDFMMEPRRAISPSTTPSKTFSMGRNLRRLMTRLSATRTTTRVSERTSAGGNPIPEPSPDRRPPHPAVAAGARYRGTQPQPFSQAPLRARIKAWHSAYFLCMCCLLTQ